MTQDNLATWEDVVNHPKHYNLHPSGIECIDISRYLSGCLAQAFQYVWRCGHKDDPVQELRKAIWFIDAELKIKIYPFIYFGYVEHKLNSVLRDEKSAHKATAFINIAIANAENQRRRKELLESAKEAINELIKEHDEH